MKRVLPLLLIGCVAALGQDAGAGNWRFAVSGDSRNCGDIVMPAIAAGVLQNRAEFYWHLGDFRAIYTFDEDLVPPEQFGLPARVQNISDYESKAWPDFIAHQLGPFGDLPIFLTIGNHETIPPMTRERYLTQFADWLEAPAVRAQRLADDAQDHALHTYFHWVKRNVDFIALDNASDDQFDSEQLKWFHALVQRDEASEQVRTIVVGMHAALPGSFGFRHSMSDWAQGEKSGREVYLALWHAQEAAHKRVYVLASHSHFYMEDVFRTTYWEGKVLAGWIVGTAGAVRYRLPEGASTSRKAMTDVYGYMIGTVAADGAIAFAFHKLSVEDLLQADQKVPAPLVHWCYDENKQ